jgi:hypothetical protein
LIGEFGVGMFDSPIRIWELFPVVPEERIKAKKETLNSREKEGVWNLKGFLSP